MVGHVTPQQLEFVGEFIEGGGFGGQAHPVGHILGTPDVRVLLFLRGRFGTDATDHDSGEIVIFQPFRFWDRYAQRRGQDDETFAGMHDHPECSFLEFGTKGRSTFWRGSNCRRTEIIGPNKP